LIDHPSQAVYVAHPDNACDPAGRQFGALEQPVHLLPLARGLTRIIVALDDGHQFIEFRHCRRVAGHARASFSDGMSTKRGLPAAMTEDKDIIRVADCHAESANMQIALFRWRNSRPVEYSLCRGLI
jgi:hypothetical protein